MNKSEKVELLGVELEWKLTGAETNNQYCVLQATIAPGAMLPPHRHPDQEAFFVLEGAPEFAVESPSGLEWSFAAPGEMINIPPMKLHGFRNPSSYNAQVLITCSPNLGRFYAHAGLSLALENLHHEVPSRHQIRYMKAVGARFGHVYPGAEPGVYNPPPGALAIENLLTHPAKPVPSRAYLF